MRKREEETKESISWERRGWKRSGMVVEERVQTVGAPPAVMPAPMMVLEKATWNWTAMKPPEEIPDTEI